MSSSTQTLGLWVRTPLEQWMSVRFFCLCCRVKVAALRRTDHSSKVSYQVSVKS
jgi:hypothetical protein